MRNTLRNTPWLWVLTMALSAPLASAQMSAEERKKMRDKEVVGYLKGQRKGEDPNKICVYDVFGKEQLVQQHKSLPCPRQLKFPPNK
ncbi:MAG: hypothetical protein ACO3OV_06700 [Steroidobacteraceae bacterium]|jgi:hypothetical protein|nr:hypothetical protein [Gammaproteobacteria bacterium]